jgi:hypothetical protein
MNTTVNTRSEESKWKDRTFSRTRLPYEPPELDVYDYEVEHGFTVSPEERIASSETVSELQDNTMGGNGENYHGEWF